MRFLCRTRLTLCTRALDPKLATTRFLFFMLISNMFLFITYYLSRNVKTALSAQADFFMSSSAHAECDNELLVRLSHELLCYTSKYKTFLLN